MLTPRVGPFSDEERMALCATLQDHLYVEMGMRFQDKELAVFSFSRERGTENGEPHLNGHYDLNTSATDKPLVTRKEHAALKAILDRATSMPVRLVVKLIPPSNRTYGYGYDFKDMVCCLPFERCSSACWICYEHPMLHSHESGLQPLTFGHMHLC